MQLFVRTLSGKTLTFDVDPEMFGCQLKQLIEEKEGIPIVRQRLIYAGKIIDDDHSLADYNIHKDATLHMVRRNRE